MDAEEDDVLTAALSSRRIPHGKAGRSRRRGGPSSTASTSTSASAASFDVKKMFGSYQLSCPKLMSGSSAGGVFDVHGLTEDGDGVVASFEMEVGGGVVQGMGVLAGSRRVLRRVVEGLEKGEESESGESDGAEEEGEEEELGNRRRAAFEKNSFRQPKFWMRWRCLVSVELVEQTESNESGEGGENVGYLVFASNDCRTFKGTMSCARLGWDNVAITGHKVTAKTKRCPFAWTDFDQQAEEDEESEEQA